MKNLKKKTLCVSVAITLLLAGCKTSPPGTDTGSGGGMGDYATSCLTGGAIGGGAAALFEMAKKGFNANTVKNNAGTIGKVMVAGCVIGIGATAIGRVMDDRQRARHEDVMQRDAKRRALESSQFAATEQRIQSAPASTPAQVAARDANLEKARTDWQNTYGKPVTTDLGNGGTSTIEAMPPKQPPAPGQASSACVDYAVFVKTAAGQAKQYDTYCPDSTGAMVRAETKAPAA